MRLRFPFPERVILGCQSRTPLLSRWTLLRLPWGNLYLHKFHRSDEDRALHDHPWPFVSLILWPGYVEETLARPGQVENPKARKWPGMLLWRRARHAHRVELVDHRPSWSLVLVGKRQRLWGFYTPAGWQDWKAYGREQGCPSD